MTSQPLEALALEIAQTRNTTLANTQATPAVVKTRAPRKTGRPCKVCTHPKRGDLERAMLSNAPGSVSRRFHVSLESIRTHRARHLPDALVESSEALEKQRREEWWADLALGMDTARRKVLEGGNAFQVAASIGSLSRLLHTKARALRIIEPGVVTIQLWQQIGVADEAEGKALINAALSARTQDRHALAVQAARSLARYLGEFPERSHGILRELGVKDVGLETQASETASGKSRAAGNGSSENGS